MLSDEQKREAVLIASVGCDREAAARYVGVTLPALNAAERDDAGFASDLQRAEAGAELAHMRNVQQAAREEKNWRASVWWLERHAPERYARRDADAVGRRELSRFLEALANEIATAVQDEDDRGRLLERVATLTQKLPEPVGHLAPQPDNPTATDSE